MADETDKVVPLPGARKRKVKQKHVALQSEGNVEVLPNEHTRLDIPVDRILFQTSEQGLAEALVLGYTAEGEFYINSTLAGVPDLIFLLALAQKTLLDG